MTRGERLKPVQQRMEEAERELAAALSAARRRVADAQRRLDELRGYERDYHETFKQRAAEGLGSLALRDYRVFLDRLGEAVRQQHGLVLRAIDDERGATSAWQAAAQRARGLSAVVTRWGDEARRQQDRRDQRDTDERAQRAHSKRGTDAARENER